MNVTEVVKRLIGEIEPIGDSRIDEKRFENLKVWCCVAEDMIAELSKVADFKSKPEHSMSRAGKFSEGALNYYKNEYLERKATQ